MMGGGENTKLKIHARSGDWKNSCTEDVKKIHAEWIEFLIHHLKKAYEQEIGLKMLEVAILETQYFKIFWRCMCIPPESSRLQR